LGRSSHPATTDHASSMVTGRCSARGCVETRRNARIVGHGMATCATDVSVAANHRRAAAWRPKPRWWAQSKRLASRIGADADSTIERLERLGHVGHIQEGCSGVQDRRVVPTGPRPPLEVTQASPEHVVCDPRHRTARPTCEISETTRDVVVQVQRRPHHRHSYHHNGEPPSSRIAAGPAQVEAPSTRRVVLGTRRGIVKDPLTCA